MDLLTFRDMYNRSWGKKKISMGLLKAHVCDMCQDFKVVDFPEALAMRREMFVMGILC